MHIELLNEFSVAIHKMIGQRFLGDLLRKSAHKEFLVTDSQMLSIPPKCRSQAAIAVIDAGYSSLRSAENDAVTDSLYEFLEKEYEGRYVFLRTEEGLIVCLFPSVERYVWKEIYESVTVKFEFPLSIGIGQECASLLDIRESYNQAFLTLSEKFRKGQGIYEFWPDTLYNKHVDYPYTYEKSVAEQVAGNGDAGTLQSIIHSFYNSLYDKGPVEKETVYSVTIRLLVSVEQSVRGENDLPALFNLSLVEITNISMLSELEKRVCGILLEMHQAHREYRPQEDQNIVELSISHMKKNVANVTLQSIAAEVFVTPNYLSLLFKIRTGKTFIETLTDLRIEEAKRQITETNLKNMEISRHIGYQDPRYFSKLFKQKVGLTPSEYRERKGGLLHRHLG